MKNTSKNLKSFLNTLQKKETNWAGSLSSVPVILLALLPKCPLCLPALMGVLSSLGISVTAYKASLFPLAVFFLLIAIASLSYHARRYREYKLLLLGLVATVCIISGKFFLASSVLLYGGIFLLILASLKNSFFRKAPQEVDPSILTDKEFQQALSRMIHLYNKKKI